MNLLIKQPLFWIGTALFLLISISSLTFLMPALLSEFQNSRSRATELNTDINSKESYLSQVNLLKNNRSDIESYFSSAEKALPATVESDTLLLQLEGMLTELNLKGATITVPFTQATTAATAATTSGDVKAGGAANTSTAPVVKSDNNQTTFTISGEMGFNSLSSLLERLRTFSRWNKVTSIELAQSGGKFTAVVSAQVFWSNTGASEFSGSTTFINTAKAVFDNLKSYATEPNVAAEGSYGRSDPFANR